MWCKLINGEFASDDELGEVEELSESQDQGARNIFLKVWPFANIACNTLVILFIGSSVGW